MVLDAHPHFQLRNPDTGAKWSGFHAFNVIGLVDALHAKLTQ
jgi:hypothetical protein